MLARRGDQFAVSDLQPYYFGDSKAKGMARRASYRATGSPVTSTPTARSIAPSKGIFQGHSPPSRRRRLRDAVRRAASVKITDQNSNEIFNKELPLSPRGTFGGEVDLPAGASLGYYSIVASFDGAQARGSFEVAEYKKPEFKVKVATPKNFVPVGEKAKFTVEAKYFFGAPVTNGDVKYYIYRSRYYHWWFRDEDDDGMGGSEESDEEGDHGYGNDMMKEGEGRLDAQDVWKSPSTFRRWTRTSLMISPTVWKPRSPIRRAVWRRARPASSARAAMSWSSRALNDTSTTRTTARRSKSKPPITRAARSPRKSG